MFQTIIKEAFCRLVLLIIFNQRNRIKTVNKLCPEHTETSKKEKFTEINRFPKLSKDIEENETISNNNNNNNANSIIKGIT